MSGDVLARYELVLTRDEPARSVVTALLPGSEEAPTLATVMDRLAASVGPLQTEVRGRPEMPGATWHLVASLEGADDPPKDEAPQEISFDVWAHPLDEVDHHHLEWSSMAPEAVEAARASRFGITVATRFTGPPLNDLHRQLRVLAAAAPTAVACLDVSACMSHPGTWLREAADTEVPPSPETLFCVHGVTGDGAASELCWLHSHGLERCGCFELEMLDIPAEAAGSLCALLNATAAMWIEHGPPPPGEPFVVGHGLELVWLPWEQALLQTKPAMGGRPDRDEPHSVPSAVLFTPGKKVLGLFGSAHKNPARLVPILEDNPVLFVSSMETRRMAALARERWDRFTDLQNKFGESDDWVFLVKLGYEMDGAEDESDAEHLWFRVHAVDGEQLEATLINEPNAIARMHEGDRGQHPLARLSDWTVLCARGRFGPDNIADLFDGSSS